MRFVERLAAFGLETIVGVAVVAVDDDDGDTGDKDND